MNKRLIAWLKVLTALLSLPILILVAGVVYLDSSSFRLRLSDFETEAYETLERMRYVAETEKFACNTLNEVFEQNHSTHNLNNAIKAYLSDHNIRADYLIWNSEGKISFSNFDTGMLSGDLTQGFYDLNEIKKIEGTGRVVLDSAEQNLRSIFGPHFFAGFFHDCFSGQERNLLRNDSAGDKSLLWVNVRPENGLVVFFDFQILKSDYGIRSFIRATGNQLITGYIDGNKFYCSDPSLKEKLTSSIAGLNLSYQQQTDLGDYYLITNFINRQKTGFCAIRKKDLKPSEEISVWSYFFTLAGALVTLLLILFSFRTIVLQRQAEIKLKWQLLFLFLFSNLVTIHVIHVLGSDYLLQLKSSMFKTSFFQSNKYLQQIDELFVSEKTALKKSLEKDMPGLFSALQAGIINKKSIRSFLDPQKPAPYLFCLIASDSHLVAASHGILSDGEVVESFSENFGKDTIKLGGIKAIQRIGYFVLNWLNKRPISAKIGTEIEYIGESLFQKKPYELVQMSVATNYFREWQMGKRNLTIFIDYLKLFDPILNDYMLWIAWFNYDLQLDFVARLFDKLNRNELGIKVFAVDDRIENAFPPDALENSAIKNSALKLRDRTLTRYEICRYENQDYLLAGYKCIAMDKIRLLGLFPVAKINKAVNDKKILLTRFVLISLLISIFLGLTISDSILKPLAALQRGMDAIQQRDFSHRIPGLGNDEFGNLAYLFNETLIDLEEMSVAQLLHEKIMTNLSEPISYNKFKIFGQTKNLSGMGGDYFEYFETPQSRPAFLLGAVSGRGIATSLILAFIKSATMQLQKHSDDTEVFLKKLNAMLHKSSQTNNLNKFSCQYLNFTSENQIILANAGLPYPMIIDHKSKSIHSLESSSLPLGCKNDFVPTLTTVELKPGQSLVCFSDGFMHRWNSTYKQIAEVVAKSFSNNPESFCSECFTNFLGMATKGSFKEDLSILIVTYPEKDMNNEKLSEM